MHPTVKLRVRQIERTIKVPLPSAIRYVKELENEGILRKENIVNITVYSADRVSGNYLLEKKLFNLKEIHYSGIVDHLIEQYGNPPIILFGSYSRGEDIESSDIDLFIQTPSKKQVNLRKFETKLQRSIQLFKYKLLHNIKNKNLSNNIINGLPLNEFIEVYR